MTKILVLGTGGTVSCSVKQDGHGRRPVYSTEEILEHVPLDTAADITYDTPIRDKHGNKIYIDSSNMQPEYTPQIAERIYHGYKHEGISGAVVLIGTDTMEEVGAYLSFVLPYKKIPVVLTGSMNPLDEGGGVNDASRNIRNAVQFASYGLPGTYIIFNRRIILANRAKKINPTSIDAFRSINFPQIGSFRHNEIAINSKAKTRVHDYQKMFADRDMELREALELRTHLLELYTGIRPEVIDNFLGDCYDGLIIEGFGTGGIPNTPPYRSLIPRIQRYSPKKFIGITSKVFTGQATTEYEVSNAAFEAGAVSLHDMLPLTALSKTNWLFGQLKRDKGKIEELVERFGSFWPFGKDKLEDEMEMRRLMLFPFEMEIRVDNIPEEDRINVEEMSRFLFSDAA